MKVLIIEDEPLAQTELIRLLKDIDKKVEIVDCLDSVEDSVKRFNENMDVDLIFLDIQLSDGISFDIFDEISTNIPIIFTTAYNEYAIKAFELNSIDYLLKPIKKEKLVKALNKFEALQTSYHTNNQQIRFEELKKHIDNISKKFKDRFMVKTGDQVKFINTNSVAYFKADDTVTYLYTTDEKRYIIDYKLEQLSCLLDDQLFFRITRSYITQINSINKISKHFNGRLKISLNPDAKEDIYISRARANEFLKWLDR